MNDKYPPLTTASLVSYSHLNPFSEVVPAEKMAELEAKLEKALAELAEWERAHNAYEL